MDKKEFIEKVCMLGIDCIILDDELINPNEIIVFTRKSKTFLRKMGSQKEMSVVSEKGRKRYIRIISYKEMGLGNWEEGLKANGVQLCEYVMMLNEEDSAAVFLYYAFVYVQMENWLYHNILFVLKRRLNLTCEEELKGWLAEYIKKREYVVKVKNIVELPLELVNLLNFVQKKVINMNQIRLKGLRKLAVKRVHIGAKIHRIMTKKKYFKYLEKSVAVGSKWSEIKVNGASGSVFVKDIQEDGVYFVKGNEMPAYQGIKNEIMIQNLLFSNAKDLTWFVPMDSSDILQKWVKYEYVTWPLLSQYIGEKGLSKEEQNQLGNYLVKVLDNLYSMGIVHNDLRCENIMVRTKKDGTLGGFVLIDFGFSSYKGSVPWKRKTFLGRYLKKSGCGRMRYSESIIDDAASALLVYLSAGGNSEDENAAKIRDRIGRLYFLCER